MKSVIYPSNKPYFKKLIPFAQKIIKICLENNINPVIYGSFAHFYYTKDEKMKVNDIDLYIKDKDFNKLIRSLKDKKIKYKYVPKWHTLIIKKGKLRVEVDGIDFWYKDNMNKIVIPKKFELMDFYGLKTKIISLGSLEKLYLVAYSRTEDNKKKILEKIKHLEGFLGRKLR